MAAAPDTILSDHIKLRPNFKLETITNVSDASPKQSAARNRHSRAYIKKHSIIMKSNASVRSWLLFIRLVLEDPSDNLAGEGSRIRGSS
jgi:hypothetical protein